MTSKDYHLLTSTGSLMKTFDDPNAALRYAEKISKDFPGVYVEEVETTVTRTVLYRSRMTSLRLVA